MWTSLHDSVAQWICHVKLTLLHITIDYQTVILYWITPLLHSISFDITRKLHVFVIKMTSRIKIFYGEGKESKQEGSIDGKLATNRIVVIPNFI